MQKIFTLMMFCACSLFLFSCGNTKKNQETASEVDSSPQGVRQETTASGKLSQSPRHHEWVTLSHGNREFDAFVAYPETENKTKAVIVIHENRGLNDWARLFADKLAAEGYLVIAPDLISNTQGKERTGDFEDPDAARAAVYDLNPAQVTEDLHAAFNHVSNDPSSTGVVAVVGFCWGGSQAFRYATNNREISSAHVFYGTAPEDEEAFTSISAPVYGYYGGNDNRVNATIEETARQMEAANKTYQYELYSRAGHAFMNRAHEEDPSQANIDAHDAAWLRLLDLLEQ